MSEVSFIASSTVSIREVSPLFAFLYGFLAAGFGASAAGCGAGWVYTGAETVCCAGCAVWTGVGAGAGCETGGTGALALIDDYLTCPFNTPYLIELDRRGENDCVFYHRTTGGFITYITSFGFKQAEGIFSDIYYFTPAWRLSAVNLSVGYINEHTRDEKLYPAWLESTIDKVDLILKDKPHTFVQPKLNLKTDFTFN